MGGWTSEQVHYLIVVLCVFSRCHTSAFPRCMLSDVCIHGVFLPL